MLARPLHDLGDLLAQAAPLGIRVADADQEPVDRVVRGMALDGDHPAVGLGLEPVAGLDLARTARIAPARSAARSSSSAGTSPGEARAEVVPGLFEVGRIDRLVGRPPARARRRRRMSRPVGDALLAVLLAPARGRRGCAWPGQLLQLGVGDREGRVVVA